MLVIGARQIENCTTGVPVHARQRIFPGVVKPLCKTLIFGVKERRLTSMWRYPLHASATFVDKKIFTKLDLVRIFHHFPIAEQDILKNTVRAL